MNLCKTCGTICPFDDERTECDAYAPMTNENWFISLSTEEKAKWLNDKIIICAVCDQRKSCGYFINETFNLCPYYEGESKSWEVWLKQPHTTIKE